MKPHSLVMSCVLLFDCFISLCESSTPEVFGVIPKGKYQFQFHGEIPLEK